MLRVIFLLLLSFTLKACMPVIFSAVAGAGVSAAKSQTIGKTIDDVRISSVIKSQLIKEHFKSIYSKVNIEVSSGRVLYTGTVSTQEDIMTAVQVAWDQEGVVEVVNELTIDNESSGKFSPEQYIRDSLITAQIKSKTLGNSAIKFANYTVVCTNDIVYLFGLARSDEELAKVTEIASTVKGVKRVVSHVKLLEPEYNSMK